MTLRSAITVVMTIAMVAGCGQSGGQSASEGSDDVVEPGTPSTPIRRDPPDRSDRAGNRIKSAEVQGIRWEPLLRYTGGRRTKSYLMFHHNGTWTGSDGCNGQLGRYTLSPDGDLTADPAPQTQIGCLGVNANSALRVSDHITVEAGRLTLHDGNRVVLELTAARKP